MTDRIHTSANQSWTTVDYTFNSQASTQVWLYAGVYGGNSGSLWLDDISINETGLIFVTRGRGGVPLKVYNPNNPNTVYNEGTDFNYIQDPAISTVPVTFSGMYHTPPTVTLPSTTTLQAGQTVAIDYYAITPDPFQGNVNMCV